MPVLVIKGIPLWLRWKSISPAVYNSLQLCMPARISPCLCVIYQLAKDLLEVSVQFLIFCVCGSLLFCLVLQVISL